YFISIVLYYFGFIFMFFFFFSSRRRHTRSYGDWSSDVCSSDLAVGHSCRLRRREWPTAAPTQTRSVFQYFADPVNVPDDRRYTRSEERRVGKEWRYRWSA